MRRSWKVLIVDDDKNAHTAAELQFKRVKVSGRRVEILSAYSTPEALQVLSDNKDVSLMIVDVVMERDNSGEELIKAVRCKLKNKKVRIVIRSGCIDLVERFVGNGFAKTHDVDQVLDKVDQSDTFTRVVADEIKKYKLVKGFFYLVKVFLVKLLYDFIKKSI